MKFFFLILIFLLSSLLAVYGQSRGRNFKQHEVGAFVGGSYYIGDLNPRKQFSNTKPAIGVFYRFAPNYRYAFRFGVNWGSIQGDDSQSNDADQLQRNLNFKTKLSELHAIAEFNFLEYRISNDKYKFTTYLFLGLDIFRFKPRANVGNLWVDLQPLKTEGQTKKYPLTQVGIPFGVGVKINVSKQVGIGLEWGPRKTYTDYLDDVSETYPDTKQNPFKSSMAAYLSDPSKNAGVNINKQRGNPRTKDWFIFFGISVNVKLNFKAPPCFAYDH